MDKIIEELQEYANFEGTELGEYIDGLVYLWNTKYITDNEPFITELEQEIIKMNNYMKENFEWAEKTSIRKIRILIPKLQED